MANIAILLPRESMVEPTKEVLNELNLMAQEIKVIETSKAVSEARDAIKHGAHLIIARGLQAYLITKYTNIPLVSISLTTSDFAVLVDQAKKKLKKEHLNIAMIGYKITLNDEYHNIAKVMNADLSMYYVDENIPVSRMFDRALSDHPDVMIGGDQVMALCKEHKIPGFFYESSKAAIKDALSVAKKMSFSIDIEKVHLSQFEALLEASYNHVYKIDLDHHIVLVNQVAETYLKSQEINYYREPIESIFNEIKPDFIEQILTSNLDVFNQVISHLDQTFNVSVLPIKNQDVCTGAIITMASMHKETKQNDALQQSYLHGYAAKTTFSKIKTTHWRYKQVLEEARMFAMSKHPITIISSIIEDSEALSESIHNHSFKNHGPFIRFYCNQESEQDMIEHLFPHLDQTGSKSVIEQAHNGTLVIHHYERLPLHVQMKIIYHIRTSTLQNTYRNEQVFTDVRYIFVSDQEPQVWFKQQKIALEFYQMLNMYLLEIPSINERKEDLKEIIDAMLTQNAHQYHRFITLSDEAINAIIEQSWTGDLSRLSGFIEKLVLTTKKKFVDKQTVDELYQTVFPKHVIYNTSSIQKSDEQIEIESLLTKYNGNRAKTAKHLNISTTTLWRKMKAYHLI